MEQFSFMIKDEFGIHARPAGLLVKEVSKFKSKIILSIENKHIPANSILGIMGLCAKQGDVLNVSINGEDENEATIAIKSFLEQNL